MHKGSIRPVGRTTCSVKTPPVRAISHGPGVAETRIEAASGKYMSGCKENDPCVFYEVKYTTPAGIVFDITESGWKGAVKEVEPKKAPGAA